MTRKFTLLFLLISVALAVAAPKRAAQIRTGTNQGVIGVKIAVPEFQSASSDPKTAALLAIFNKVLWDDLDYAGGLTLVSRSLYPLGKFAGPGDIKPEAWTAPAVDAQFIAFGSIQAGNGSMSVEARLWDLKATQNREAIGQRYKSDDTDEGARFIAHKFADAIVDLISGGKGIAQTSIAYISERTPGVKELYTMDYDGSSAHALTAYKSTVLTPAWSPDGEKIAFTSYRRGIPDIEILSRSDNRPYTFERPGGTTTTPAWSPDGSKIAFATSRDGSDMEIYVADWNGKNLRRLTVSKGVDISPVWNPRTGREIAFTSDRSGSPQIYIMDAEGTNVRRLIEEGGHAVNAAWSPDGQRIAFAWQKARSNFDIYIHDLTTGQNTQLTSDAGSNEKPTWAPDGRHIAFESSRTGTKQIFSMILDGTKIRQLTNAGNNTGPAWSGFFK
ncbi:MAG TPA: Tol-Pal system beta propeller repeat protein TolB [Terriglobia bacterium]|nr:Tol-Pal system beta propeller repeat protein TolB [Terriglobia bacterium]